ncbi:TadE family protein [Agromyces sp. NPDC060279]|uniref:TadE family protein n=1 Tax=Agromyces sp. NPDC060279 TaxID=3347092 RepID=UPI003647BF6E
MRNERGSASLEFLGAALLLMLPIVYLVLALGDLQAAAFAAEGASRHGARVAVREAEASDVRRSANAAVDLVLDDFGRSDDERRVVVDCGGARCDVPGARVRVTVQLDVRLPFAPPVLGLDRVLVVPIEASALQTVSRWSATGDGR